jgi:ParB family chromosome partitioning protein
VPVVVREADDMASLEQALVENLHRQDLNVLEEAAAYQQLVDEFSMTQDKVAKRVGKSRSAVANTLRLLALPTAIQRLVSENRLSAGHARAVLPIEDTDEQVTLAEQIVSEQLTVRQAEDLVRERMAPAEAESEEDDTANDSGNPAASVGTPRDAAVLELEELLSERLSTKVNVSLSAKRGKIVIDYADLDDLERIYHLINGDS